MITPRQELADLTADAMARGMSTIELSKIQRLGNDGYGIVAQLEQLYVWLEKRPSADKLHGVPAAAAADASF